MRSRRQVWMSCAVVLVVLGAVCGHTQTIPAVPDSTADALRAMSQMATVIFSGQVVAIRRLESVVEIDFAIEDAVRGTRGGVYTLREWAGLWAAGNEPLRVGQRYLMLLHAPGAAGLSSPVGGTDGAIPISMTLAGGGVVDLRWIVARTERNVSYGREPLVQSSSLPVAVRARAAQVDMTVTGQREVGAFGDAPYAAVAGLLRSREKADAAR
jgi:hypothetical protein